MQNKIEQRNPATSSTHCLCLFIFLAAFAVRSPGSDENTGWPRHVLKLEKSWQLNPPKGEQFDASGLLLRSNGDLLTVNDKGASLYRIVFRPGTNSADLMELAGTFTREQLAGLAREKHDRFDCEGIAEDSRKRLYLCEEADRWVLRFDPETRKVDRLEIDWTPVKPFLSADRNASWEGIAVGGGRLFLANERQMGRIVVVDLETFKVTDHFTVRPKDNFLTALIPDVHYSDLSWHDGYLYILARDRRAVLKVDPATKQVRAEYDYSAVESDPEAAYSGLTIAGLMEGLAVDRDHFWLVVDNNGQGRLKYPNDTRPTLFKCPRPDAGRR